jgi:hypothetical protein
MDALGKEFFAGAAFACDEDGRCIGLGDFGCQMFQQFHLGRPADDLIECEGTLCPGLRLWRFEDVGLVDGGLEILRGGWLCEVVSGATVQGLDRGFCRPVCSEDDHGEVLSGASSLRQNHLARNPSLAFVTYDEYEVGLVFQDAQAFFGRCSRKNGGGVAVEGFFEQRSGVGIG